MKTWEPEASFSTWLENALSRAENERTSSLYLGGDPPELPGKGRLFTPRPQQRGGLAGEPFWTLAKLLAPKEEWESFLYSIGFRFPLLPAALQILTGEETSEEDCLSEESPFHRSRLPKLMGTLMRSLVDRDPHPVLVDLGETSSWGDLTKAVLSELQTDFPGVFLLRVRIADVSSLVPFSLIDGEKIRWEPGAFLMPEEPEETLPAVNRARMGFLNLKLGCWQEALTLVPPSLSSLGAEERLITLLLSGLIRLQEGALEESLPPLREGLAHPALLDYPELLGQFYLAYARANLGLEDRETAALMIRSGLETPGISERLKLNLKYWSFKVNFGTITWSGKQFEVFQHELLPLLEGLEQAGWLAHWAELATSISSFLHFCHKELKNDVFPLVRKALKIARDQKNLFRLSKGYQTLGVLFQERLYYRQALKAYLKSFQVRKKVGEGLELARLQVGLGFYHTSLGHYTQGRRHLSAALHRLKESRDYGEIAAALYNLGVNAYFSGHPAQGIEPLTMALDLMNQAGIDNLPFTHRIDFHAVLGLCALALGQKSSAWNELTKARTLANKQEDELQLLLLPILQGLLNDDDRFLERVMDQLLPRREPERHIFIDLCLRWSQSLLRREKKAKAQEIVNMAREWLDKRQDLFPWQRVIFQGELPLGVLEGAPDWGTLSIPDLRIPFLMVQQDRHLKDLRQQFHRTHFLNEIHRITAIQTLDTLLVPQFLDLLFQAFPLREAWILFSSPQKRELFEYRKAPFIRGRDMAPGDFWLIQTPEIPGSGLLSQTAWQSFFGPREQGVWIPLEGGRGGKGLLLGVVNTESPLGPESLKVVSLAAHQMLLALELRWAWDQLEKAAHEDTLTGLLNRNSLPLRFREISSARIPKHASWMSLLYLDLDNFKGVNDSFGHAEGDKLLEWFSRQLKKLVRSSDSLARVGGDEFIILLPGEKEDGAVKLAERILGLFRQPDAYLSHLQTSLPPEKQVTCSLGIHCSPLGNAEMLDHWMSLADKALYKAKNRGKNQYALTEREDDSLGRRNN